MVAQNKGVQSLATSSLILLLLLPAVTVRGEDEGGGVGRDDLPTPRVTLTQGQRLKGSVWKTMSSEVEFNAFTGNHPTYTSTISELLYPLHDVPEL